MTRFTSHLIVLSIVLAAASVLQADDTPPETSPSPSRAIEFAKRDAERLAAQAAPLSAKREAAAKLAAETRQQIETQRQSLATAEEQLKKLPVQVKEATTQLQAANEKIQAAQAMLPELNAKLATLTKLREELEPAVVEHRKTLNADKATFVANVAKLGSTDEAGLVGLSESLAGLADRLAEDAQRIAKLAPPYDKALGEENVTRAALEAAQKSLAENQELHKQAQLTISQSMAALAEAETTKKSAGEQLAALEPMLKVHEQAALAAKTEAAPIEEKLKIAQERLVLVTETSTAPVPKDIREVQVFKHSRALYSCEIDDTGEYVFAGAFGNDVQRWALSDGADSKLTGHNSWVRRMTLDPAGRTLLTAGYEGRLIWWDALEPAPKPQRSVEAHHGFTRGVAISPDGTLVATCGNDLLVKVWSFADGTLVKELSGHERHIYNVRFSPDGTHLISGDLMGQLYVWETAGWTQVRKLEAPVLSKYDKSFRADCGGIRGMDFSPDGKVLAVSGISEVTNAFAGIGEPTVVLFDWREGKQLNVLKKPKFRGACWGVKWHPSGEFLVGAGGGSGGALWFWKPDKAEPFYEFKLPNVGYALDFHPDGLRLAVAVYDKTLRLYDLAPRTATEVVLAEAAAAAKKAKKK